MSRKLWDAHIYTAHITTMEGNPSDLISYISRNLRSLSRIGLTMSDNCGVGGFGENPPDTFHDEAVNMATRISSAEVALSQLSAHLAIACDAVLRNKALPSMALKLEARANREENGFAATLDDYGAIYTSYIEQKRQFKRHIDQMKSIRDPDEEVKFIVWDRKNTTGDQALGYIIASEAFYNARDRIISLAISNRDEIDGN